MSPLDMLGPAFFGAAIGIGLLAEATWRPTQRTPQMGPASRRLAMILMVSCGSGGLLGIIVGVLAVTTHQYVDATAALSNAGLMVVGTVMGLGLIEDQRRSADPEFARWGAVLIGSLAVLGIGVITAAFVGAASTHRVAGPFVILGFVSCGSTVAIGMTGTRTLRGLLGADEVVSKALGAAQISRTVRCQVAAVGASIIAILVELR